jgi:hypothetical protein
MGYANSIYSLIILVNKMKNRLQTESSVTISRGNPYYRLPGRRLKQRAHIQSSEQLTMPIRSDLHKCQ